MGNSALTLEKPENRSLQMFSIHEHFCKAMLDAFVVVDNSGKVLKSNQFFSILTGLKSRQVLKAESLNEMLTFCINGRPIPIEEILKYRSPIRVDEVRAETKVHDSLNLILGIYPFIEGDETHGAFILIRDVTAETALQGKYKVKATQSITDPLTGLYNRGYFDSFLPRHIEKCAEHPIESDHYKVSVIMLDIDHFKRCNDTYGHQAGDFVIKEVADRLKENFRKTDVICRYGGEEFLAILPTSDLAGARIAAEKIRQTIESHVFEFEGTTIPVLMSSGVAQIDVQTETAKMAVGRADEALYYSKENGRNRVSCHHGGGKIT